MDDQKLSIETVIRLNKFKPRDYQLPICKAIASEGGKFRKLLVVLPRRAGKDILMWNLMIRAAIKDVGNYFYCLPTFAQARSVIWDSITNDSQTFVSFIPPELIAKKLDNTMQITLINGSQIKLIGSDSYNTSIIGTNPKMIIFSEYALADENAYKLAAMPILRANNGIVALISTPRGKNAMYELFQIAKNSPEWFTYFKTVEDTGHISIDDINRDIESGEISIDMARQEYWCSWDMGQEGALYAKYIQKMRLEGRIGIVPWEPYHKVYTAWDLGIADPTCIIFFQVIGEIIRVIDYYEASDRSMDHFARVVLDKPYVYAVNGHFPPHDIMARESARGLTKREMYKELGIKFTEPVQIDIEDGIELVRRTFSKMWIDEKNCKQLIKALENYRYEWDDKTKRYKNKPLHDWSSHACFIGETLISTNNGDIKIEDIMPGMKVRTPFGYRKVLKTHKRLSQEFTDIYVGTTKITSTPHHDIFTQRGMIKSDSLRYNDTMEYNSLISGYLWKKIYTSYGEELGLKGFKKYFLSLKMGIKRSLMDTFIDGMAFTINQQRVDITAPQTYTGLFGFITMVQSRLSTTFTTLMMTQKIIISRIFNVFQQMSTVECTLICPEVGQNQNDVNRSLDHLMQRQQSGTEVIREESGIKNMHRIHCQTLLERSTKRTANLVQSTSLESKRGNYSVLMLVKHVIESLTRKISLIGLVVSVKMYSFVINTLLKKHVVKDVQSYQLETPKAVYDLTIETDNCYYANGYLVSNSDSMRYLCAALPKTRSGGDPEALERRYQDAVYGQQSRFSGPFKTDGFGY